MNLYELFLPYLCTLHKIYRFFHICGRFCRVITVKIVSEKQKIITHRSNLQSDKKSFIKIWCKKRFGYSLFITLYYNNVECNAHTRVPSRLRRNRLYIKLKGRQIMDKSHRMPRLSFFLMLGVTVLGVILRTAALLTSFDTAVGYFDLGFLSVAARACYFIAPAIAIVTALCIPKGVLPTELSIRAKAPVAYVTGVSLVVFGVASLALTLPAKTMTAPAILALPAAAYFLLSAGRTGRFSSGLSAFGFAPVLWAMAAIAQTYGDRYTTMNSPIKLALQFGFVGVMLLFCAELRFRLGKPLPRMAVALFSISIFTTLNASLPILLATVLGVLTNTLHTLYAVALLCVGLYALFMLGCYLFDRTPDDDKIVTQEICDSETSSTPDASEV